MRFKRRTALCMSVLAVFPAVASVPTAAGEQSGSGTSEASLPETARQIHQRILTLDAHVDIAGAHYATPELDPGVDHPKLKCDLVKMTEGGVDAVFLAVFVKQRERDAAAYQRAFNTAIAKFHAIRRLANEMHPERCELATSPDDVRRIVATGKRAILIGLENGYPVGTDLANLERFYDLGARYVTLSHNGHNQICDSCNPSSRLGDDRSEHGGLSEFGKQVVAEVNRLGMMVDVSHVAPQSFWDLVEVSKAPIIASHSGCRALADNRRNLDDGQLEALAEKGGVIQIVAVGSFLKVTSPRRREAVRRLVTQLGILVGQGDPDLQEVTGEQRQQYVEGMKEIDNQYPTATIRDFVDHVDHAVRVAGIDHVGIGSDFDGGGGIPGFNDHSEALNVTVELLRRGYSESDIEKIWGGNLLRVWAQVEQVAARLQTKGGT